MSNAFSRAFSQLSDPAFRKVLVRSLLLTGLVFGLLIWASFEGFGKLPVFEWDWVNSVAPWIGRFSVVVILLLLFPAVATLFVCLFLDDIVDAVDARYYPGAPVGSGSTFSKSLVIALRYTAIVVLLNLAVVPLYLMLFWLPLAWPVIYYSLNGYLLGREYFELVAQRHGDRRQIDQLRRANSRHLFWPGVVITFLLQIPVLNFAVPVVAAAAMTHVFRGLTGEGPAA